MANITAVIPSPRASLRGTAFLLVGYSRVTKGGVGYGGRWSGGHGRKLSAYRLGVGPHWPWYFDFRPSEP